MQSETTARAAEQARLEADRKARQLTSAGIPPRFADCTFATYSAESVGSKKAKAFCESLAAECHQSGRSALFVGKPGTGKTHLAIAIAKKMLERGRTACYTTVQRMVRRVKDTWSEDRVETEKQAIQALASVHLLILDEVGVQFGSPFEENLMFDVLNSRYENRLPTILISNLTSEKAATFLGERVVDRLREDGGSVVVFDWQSHRRVQ